MAVTQLAWVIEQPGTKSQDESSLYNENGLRSRRFHHKSKKGCKGCKQRRVKCDEGLPGCNQCRDKGVQCEYPRGSRPSPHPIEHRSVTEDSNITRDIQVNENSNHGITSDPAIANRIMQVLIESNAPCVELENTAVYKKNHALDVIDHFHDCRDSWLGSPTCQRILQEHGIRLAMDAGHLVHAIIAISAAHLAERQTLPEEKKKFWIASTLHYHHSLGMYSSAILGRLEDQDADAIFASGLLHAMLAFIKTPKESELIALEDDSGPTWIMSMRGIRTLIDTPGVRKRLEGGIWLPLLEELNRWQITDLGDSNRCEPQVPPSAVFFRKGLCNPAPTSPYAAQTTAQLTTLHKLFRPDATYHNITGFLAFIADATPEFIERVRADHEEALLVLAYWCALFSRFDQWWISESATIECKRICTHLDKSHDSRIRNLLAFPANTCGYELNTMALG